MVQAWGCLVCRDHALKTEITDAADYASAMSEIRRLWDAPIGSADGDRLDMLVDLVIAYEAKNFPDGQ